MIVNSSQGGGSKDTWVLEEDGRAGRTPRAAAGRLVAAAAARPAPERRVVVRPATAAAAVADARPDRPRAVLDRPPARRAPSTPRACSTASSTPTCRGAAGRPGGVAPVVGRAAGDHGRRAARAPADARRGRPAAHARPRAPDVASLNCVTQRARGRAHGARRVLGRDVGGDQHLPPRAAAARHLRRAAHRPVLGLRLRARALRAVLGRDRAARCCATRRTRSCEAGARDRGRRHGAADAARRAARRRRRRRRPRARRPGARAAAGGRRLPGVPARGPRAAERAARSARFLLYERDYPDSVASSVEALHEALTAADAELPQLRRPCCGSARLHGRPRLPLARARRRRRRHRPRRSRTSSASSRRSTPTSPSATSAARPPPAPRLATRLMHFAIRYLTEYRYEAPVTRQPQRAAGEAGDDRRPSASTTSACASTRRRACTSTSTTSARP